MAPAYLGLFCASTVASLSILGGVFAVLPAYEADLYGPKYVLFAFILARVPSYALPVGNPSRRCHCNYL